MAGGGSERLQMHRHAEKGGRWRGSLEKEWQVCGRGEGVVARVSRLVSSNMCGDGLCVGRGREGVESAQGVA